MNKKTFWHVEVPKNLDEAVEYCISKPTSVYKTKSEFIRDAVRAKLSDF